jgi:hypothetical protein
MAAVLIAGGIRLTVAFVSHSSFNLLATIFLPSMAK